MNAGYRSATLFICLILALPDVATAQENQATISGNTGESAKANLQAPIFDSAGNAERLSTHHFASAEDDARPGEYFFGLAVQALSNKDYVHAIAMYKVAASWAYKPAEYNLGVIYAHGSGVPMDLPRALAWLTLAAERNDRDYVMARDLINSKLSGEQFNQANAIFARLKPIYGDETALRRAKARWAQVRAAMTGSRVGSMAGNLRIGGPGNGNIDPGARIRTPTTGMDILSANSIDGSLAYQQLWASNNPYDPKFEWRPGHQHVTVGPLTPATRHAAANATKSAVEPTDPPAGNPNFR